MVATAARASPRPGLAVLEAPPHRRQHQPHLRRLPQQPLGHESHRYGARSRRW
jgi:hypothetical protein